MKEKEITITSNLKINPTIMKAMSNSITVKVGMKLRVSGRIMKVQSINGDQVTLLHENGCLPARHSDRIKDLGFLQRCAKAV